MQYTQILTVAFGLIHVTSDKTRFSFFRFSFFADLFLLSLIQLTSFTLSLSYKTPPRVPTLHPLAARVHTPSRLFTPLPLYTPSATPPRLNPQFIASPPSPCLHPALATPSLHPRTPSAYTLHPPQPPSVYKPLLCTFPRVRDSLTTPFRLKPPCRALTPQPFFHIYGLIVSHFCLTIKFKKFSSVFLFFIDNQIEPPTSNTILLLENLI